MKEVELKFKIPDNGNLVKSKIKKSKAKYGGKYVQIDLWFDTEDKQLRREGKGLRVRRQNGKTTLTLKGKQTFGEVREAEEQEVAVDNFEEILKILGGLGFVVDVEIRKERKVWKLGEVAIALDKVDGLGTFLELEGPQGEIEKTIKILGLESLPRTSQHYGQLLEEKIYDKSSNF